MIIGEIRRFLRDNNMVRVSRSIRDLAYRSLCEKERLGAKLGREPTLSEICAELNCHFSSDQESTAYQGPKVTEADIASALDAIITPVSIYEPIYSDGGDSVYLSDQLSDEEAGMDSWTENIALAEAMKALGERERNILMLRFYADKTQTEVAREIGISQAQVSRLEKSALGRIKKQL
ncbi:RNA polymerase sigma-G factor [bioreactor metagenome]|uniref:RNA polymerase sigma-G factor n=1 Tax=bioreactor metagenome TaxID=1076179 RepID=A0A645HC86_9ZZZZ